MTRVGSDKDYERISKLEHLLRAAYCAPGGVEPRGLEPVKPCLQRAGVARTERRWPDGGSVMDAHDHIE